ncbi:MAG: ribonuclease PH [Kiritimatiellae bacterium]|nr:ribonuclease PH [Kiritimatiellia bacterium]
MAKKEEQRADGRRADQLRPVELVPGVAPAAAGSVLIKAGRTQVLCAAMVDESVPRWMREQGVAGGWLTAEYSLLPYATARRTSRESTAGRVGGRTQEIQRLIGRSLRAVSDLEKLGTRTIWVDCDVVQADGGTRTAAITGAFVALRLAVNRLVADGLLQEDPLREAVAAVSVGLTGEQALLDLCYDEDVAAEVDMNVVMTASGKFVEVQGTAESRPFSRTRLQKMLALAEKGIRELLKAQERVLKT